MPYYKYYHYDPSLAASVIFAILFAATTCWHAFHVFRYRSWYIVPALVGGAFELAGYIARAVSHAQAPHMTLGPYVVETLLILVAPPLFAATVYMTLKRGVIGVDGEKHSLVKTRWLAKIFVISDVVCFVVQLGGAGLMSSSHATTATTGAHVVLAGLLVQIVIFGFFIVVAAVFQRRMAAAEDPQRTSKKHPLPWRRTLLVIYVTSALILVRNIVRVAEFIEGFDGYIILHETFLYVFDAVPMLAVSVAFNIWYPWQFETGARAKRSARGATDGERGEVEMAESA